MKRLATAALVIALASAVSAQNQFEVASVKKVTNNEGILTVDFAPERLELLMPLREIIRVAYDLRDFQVASQDEMRVMLQRLLAERFQLKVHRVTKTAPSYELVLARGDGKPGPPRRHAYYFQRVSFALTLT